MPGGNLARMDVFISADIEGVTGLVSWSQCSRPDGLSYDYPFARRMMTHDVNAAIRGARRAGAARVVVKDSHGNSKNLLIDELEPGTELISGHGGGIDGMMEGVGEGFGAAILVGYHAMAGTAMGVMEHTISGSLHRLTLNGVPVGEIGLAAGVAHRHGVPLVLVTSDEAGCEEAIAQLPGVLTVPVKEGLARYMARSLHPSETGPAIEAAAEAAVRRAHTRPELPMETAPGLVRTNELASRTEGPLPFDGPVHVRMEFNRSEQADMLAKLPLFTRADGYGVEGRFDDFEAAHRAVWVAIPMAEAGLEAQR